MRVKRSIRHMPQEIQDEALRRAAEKGGDPDEHLAAMMQETIDELTAAGIAKPIYKKPQA